MSSAELKLKLEVINQITGIEDIRIIEKIKQLLDFELNQGIYKLSEEQQNRIDQGRMEYEKGEVLTEAEANAEIDRWLKESNLDHWSKSGAQKNFSVLDRKNQV